jgi:hypothetical protein
MYSLHNLHIAIISEQPFTPDWNDNTTITEKILTFHLQNDSLDIMDMTTHNTRVHLKTDISNKLELLFLIMQ